jgi:hypothetical protein
MKRGVSLMLYISGIHALNLPCALLTCGDWHQSAIRWDNLSLLDSADTLFGDYGIERDKAVPGYAEVFNAANHIRALLDLLEQGKFSVAQGMNEDFICNDCYNDEIFSKVSLMKGSKNWPQIDRFMGKEYASQWLEYKKERISA